MTSQTRQIFQPTPVGRNSGSPLRSLQHRPSSIVHRPSSVIRHHPSSIIHHPSSALRRPPSIIRFSFSVLSPITPSAIHHHRPFVPFAPFRPFRGPNPFRPTTQPTHPTQSPIPNIQHPIPTPSPPFRALRPLSHLSRSKPFRAYRGPNPFAPIAVQTPTPNIQPTPVGSIRVLPPTLKFHQFSPTRHNFAHLAQNCGIIRSEHLFAFAKQNPSNRLPATRQQEVQ